MAHYIYVGLSAYKHTVLSTTAKLKKAIFYISL